MNEISASGFAVVLSSNEGPSTYNPRYRGIGRMPSYPTEYIEEAPVLDDYVFADYKSLETNLIPTYARAVELWERLRISRREFDLLAWCSGPNDAFLTHFSAQKRILGYEVAGISGDYWSIVDDIPSTTWTERYRQQLNSNGLFDDRSVAEAYLSDYRQRQEADWDSAFEVGLVVQVLP